MSNIEPSVLAQALPKRAIARSEPPPRETAAITEPRYRRQAMASHATGQLLNATGPRAWAWFGVPLLIVGVMVIASIAAKIELVSASPARVRRQGGQVLIRVPVDARVAEWRVQPGSSVATGQALLVLAPNVAADPVVISAPRQGYLDTVAVEAGESARSGAIAGLIVPSDASLEVVSSVAERDRPFIKVGQEIRLQLGPLPERSLSNLRARISRVGGDLVTRSELGDTFGASSPEGPAYLVYLELVQDDNYRKISRYVRPGMLMEAKYVLRTRRLAAWILDPLGRWLR